MEKLYIKKCHVCDNVEKYKVDIVFEKQAQKTEQIMRATVLKCGHQGLFSLEVKDV